MPIFFLYLLKLSISVAVVYLFYQLLLRRLTFYYWNRFYLLGYTILSFFIPFINITPVLERSDLKETKIVHFIPQVDYFNHLSYQNSLHEPATTSFDFWSWTLLLFTIGMLVLLTRFVMQLLSFRKMIRKSKFITDGEIKICEVTQDTTPFSFGRCIFINKRLHSETELKEIIRHEIVHVQERHTFDVLLGELLCIVNWYNPFAWLIRKSIRQNLEFIADNKVLQSGIDKKQYQYLLLKVIGNNHFSIAQNFNFSSLKKRIAMMNKMKSAKLHLVKFLFVLPLIAVLLLAFRSRATKEQELKEMQSIPAIVIQPGSVKGIVDTLPVNSKGYFIDVIDKKGNCTVVIKNKNEKELKRMLLTKWNENKAYYTGLYGPLPAVEKDEEFSAIIPVESETVSDIGSARISFDDSLRATVTTHDGKIENYNLQDDNQRKIFEKKYHCGTTGTVRSLEQEPAHSATTFTASLAKNAREINSLSTTYAPAKTIGFTSAESNRASTVSVAGMSSQPTIATTVGETLQFTAEPAKEGSTIIEITNNTQEGELLQLLSDEMKAKGYSFNVIKSEYRNGKLVYLKGTISINNFKKTFTISDFSKFQAIEITGINDKRDIGFNISDGSLVWN
ncbi:MAG: M56 family metallopeptidase [Chitinophagaceae bacterium]